ncbi:MAG TPA: branched-chain amino acid ABC transporter permease, partial [Candidatus Methylomirabilis sp.]|nr:branched-chain amino acid ABC transporter permease [Candidatus Methylomirabilis sp.]
MPTKTTFRSFRAGWTRVPLLGWLFGAFLAVMLERLAGAPLALAIGLPKVPALFGLDIMLKKPLLLPNAALYVLLIYGLPVGMATRASIAPANRLAGVLLRLPLAFTTTVYLGLLYAIFHVWAEVSDYRDLVVRLTLISIMLTLSLNVINGYMGEFSCSHPGFMALGAYCTSVFTLGMFVDTRFFGTALLPPSLGPILFPVALVLGGCLAAAGAMLVAIPSFRTRGDYLAIISLAFLFIVKSLIENLEYVRGPRGLSGQPDWANLPTVFAWTAVCVWSINNFVRSTLGKALNAVRDNEMAADAMTVDTRRTKMVAFLFSAFWAGIAGGLFAHVLRYVNPGTFGIQNLAEVLAMVYFGGLNSVYGS